MKAKKILVLGFASAIFITGCGAQNATNSEKKTPKIEVSEIKQIDLGNNSNQENNTNPPQLMEVKDQKAAPQAGDTVAILDTSKGQIKIKLFAKEVPTMATNFIELAKQGKYNNVKFHKVIKDFMIQTGDFERGDGRGGHSYKGKGTKLPDEFNMSLEHLYGAVSMANAGPNTNGSQFFIVTKKDGTSWLDGRHAVFGQVYEGMNVAEAIQETQIPGDDMGLPSEDVLIKSVEIKTL